MDSSLNGIPSFADNVTAVHPCVPPSCSTVLDNLKKREKAPAGIIKNVPRKGRRVVPGKKIQRPVQDTGAII